MKLITSIVAIHLAVLLALVGLGLLLNDTIRAQKFVGVTTILSGAFGVYCFAVNILYHKNQHVFMLVNRLLLLVRRTHTYWLPAFDFTLSDSTPQNRSDLVDQLESALATYFHKKIRRVNNTSSGMDILINETLCLTFRFDESHLHVTLDRKMLVPAHLYERDRQMLAGLAEVVSNVIRPDSTRLAITITFDEGVTNPYFGFFIQRVPAQLLRHFEASFLFGRTSSCRIQAGIDRIDIESPGAVDFFDALSQVQGLRVTASPGCRRR